MSATLNQAIEAAAGQFHSLAANPTYVAKLARAMKDAGEVADCLSGQAAVKAAALVELAKSNEASEARRAARSKAQKVAVRAFAADVAALPKISGDDMLKLAPVAWENDKSVGIDGRVYHNEGGDVGRVRVFFAKSQIKDGAAPRWLVKKAVEAALIKYVGAHEIYKYGIAGVTA